MSNQTHLKPIALALGTVFAASLAGTGVASADQNPFSMTELSSGYMVADSHEGKCGEGKCGGTMKSDMENKADKEGKCGGAMKTDMKGKTDKAMKADKEGKCGEGKCGGAK